MEIGSRRISGAMLKRTDPLRVKPSGGFSLLDLKKFAETGATLRDGYAEQRLIERLLLKSFNQKYTRTNTANAFSRCWTKNREGARSPSHRQHGRAVRSSTFTRRLNEASRQLGHERKRSRAAAKRHKTHYKAAPPRMRQRTKSTPPHVLDISLQFE
jgi:hypothetical protein